MKAVEKQRQVNFGIGETSTQIGILQVRQTLCRINLVSQNNMPQNNEPQNNVPQNVRSRPSFARLGSG